MQPLSTLHVVEVCQAFRVDLLTRKTLWFVFAGRSQWHLSKLIIVFFYDTNEMCADNELTNPILV